MLNITILQFLLLAFSSQPDTLKEFHKQLEYNIQRDVNISPEVSETKDCYHRAELIKVEINNLSKITSLGLSDSAPDWLIKEFERLKIAKRIDFAKLDSIAKKSNLRSCTLVFPLFLESDDFPCGDGKKIRSYPDNYFKFNGKYLGGKLIFGKEITAIFHTHYSK